MSKVTTEQHIEMKLEQGRSQTTAASITIVNPDGTRKARAWVGIMIDDRGVPYFTLNVLRKTSEQDTHRRLMGSWHDDLR